MEISTIFTPFFLPFVFKSFRNVHIFISKTFSPWFTTKDVTNGNGIFKRYPFENMWGWNVKKASTNTFLTLRYIKANFYKFSKIVLDVKNFQMSYISMPFLPSFFSCSTINPILYNVMSHRYRVAFRDTLCSRKRGFYSSANGFVRDQSSFRETTIAAASRDHNLNYEGSQLVTFDMAISIMFDHQSNYSLV